MIERVVTKNKDNEVGSASELKVSPTILPKLTNNAAIPPNKANGLGKTGVPRIGMLMGIIIVLEAIWLVMLLMVVNVFNGEPEPLTCGLGKVKNSAKEMQRTNAIMLLTPIIDHFSTLERQRLVKPISP
jgi:hypothetical protein